MAKTNQIKPDFENIIITGNSMYYDNDNYQYTMKGVLWNAFLIKFHLKNSSGRCIIYKTKETYTGSVGSYSYSGDFPVFYLLGNSSIVSEGWKSATYSYSNSSIGPIGGSGGPTVVQCNNTPMYSWEGWLNIDAPLPNNGVQGGISYTFAGQNSDLTVNRGSFTGISGTFQNEFPPGILGARNGPGLETSLTNDPTTTSYGVNIFTTNAGSSGNLTGWRARSCSIYTNVYGWRNTGSSILPTTPGGECEDFGGLYANFYDQRAGGQKYDESNPYDSQPRFLNIYVSEDLEACKKYIADGTVPDDATIDAPKDDDTDASKNKRTDTDEDDGHPEDDTDDHDDTEQTETQATRPININYYHIQSGELASILRWFWNDIYSNFDVLVANTMTGMFGNLTQCIIGLKKFNCPTNLYNSFVNTSTMYKIGRYSLNAILPSGTTDLYSREPTKPITVGSIAVTEKYGNFVDRAPYTSIELYLPFVGIVPLDVNSVMSHTITVTAVASIRTGEIEYHVYVVDSNGKHLISTYTGVCAEEVPYALDNALAIKGQTISKIGSVAGSLIPGISSATNLLDGGTIAPTNYNTNSSNDLAKFAPDKCALIIKRKKYNLPSNFGSKKGYIACKGRSLKGLNGKVWIDDFCLPTFYSTSPTKKEIEEIKRLFKEGVEIN